MLLGPSGRKRSPRQRQVRPLIRREFARTASRLLHVRSSTESTRASAIFQDREPSRVLHSEYSRVLVQPAFPSPQHVRARLSLDDELSSRARGGTTSGVLLNIG